MKTSIRKELKTFLIGQDAELYLLSHGQPAPFEGDIKSEFGLDGATGAARICEVRTPPSQCPIEIVNHIHQVFKRKIKTHPKTLSYDWHGGSFKIAPLGGHIHAGIDKKAIRPSLANKIVANYAGALSMAVEVKDEAYKRRNHEDHNYGFLSDMRMQPWGWESRCFSSWLVSPAIAAAHLCLFKTVLNETLNNKSFSPNERFNDDDFFDVNQEKVRNHFDSIWSEITSMQLYPEYKQYIDIFKFLIENKLSWYPKNMDVKVAWGLNSGTFQTEPKKLELKHIWGNEQVAGIF